MNKLLSVKYIPAFFLTAFIWAQWLSYRVQPPFFMVSIPLILSSFYIIFVTSKFFFDNKLDLKSKRKQEYYFFLLIQIYGIYSLVKLLFVPSPFDFLREILWVLSANYLSGIILFVGDRNVLKPILNVMCRYLSLIVLLYVFIMGYGLNVLDSFVFFIPFVEFLPKRRKWIVYLAIFFAIIMPGQRMALLRMASIVLFYLLFRFDILTQKRILKLLQCTLSILPIIFLILALTDTFNIFNIEEFSEKDIQYKGEELFADSRTDLFRESIKSALDNNYIGFGRSFGYGYDSEWWIQRHDVPQRNSEVFMLNIFTWMGILGVIAHMLIFIVASHKAIHSSNNKYMRFIGFLVIIQWVLCWVENSNSYITMSILFMWLEVGWALSPYWRNLSDWEFEEEIRDAFNINHKILVS